MGVMGSGKTTFGKTLAEHLGYDFLDADDFHSAANREKLTAGTALDDTDRAPWLQSLNATLLPYSNSTQGVVLACSALREAYREILLRGVEKFSQIIYLQIDHATAASRLRERNHFANPALLESQFATLEEPKDAITLPSHLSIAEAIDTYSQQQNQESILTKRRKEL